MIKFASKTAFGTITVLESYPKHDIEVLGVEINPDDFVFPSDFSKPTEPVVVQLIDSPPVEQGDIVTILKLTASFGNNNLIAQTSADIPRMEDVGLRRTPNPQFPQARHKL